MITRRRKLMYTVLIWAIVLVLAEVGLRVVSWAKGDLLPAWTVSQEEEWEWAAKHLALGVPRLETLVAHDARLGWRVKAGLSTPEHATNSVGMRARVDLPTAGQRPRIVCVGDSYTWGLYATDEQTYPAALATRLPSWEVLNLGVPGYGCDQAVLMFEHVGRTYGPKVVVMGFFHRDYFRSLRTFRFYAKPRFVPDGAGLRVEGVPVPSPEALFADYLEGRKAIAPFLRCYVLHKLVRSVGRLRERRIGSGAAGWRLMERLMARFQRQVVAAGATPVWLVIPRHDVLEGEGRFEALDGLCQARARALGMGLVLMSPVFRAAHAAHPDRTIYRPREQGGHLSPYGYGLVAKAVHAHLVETGRVSAPR